MKNNRLVMLLSQFPQQSETFIVNKFIGLLKRGWDVHIVCNQFNPESWRNFTELASYPQSRTRIHQGLPTQPRVLAVLLLIPTLLFTLLTAPQTTWRYLRKGWQRFGWGIFKQFYLDAPLVRLNPDIIHFEFGSLAVGRTYLKVFLDTKLSVSFRGYDLNFAGLEEPTYYDDLWQTVDACHFLSKHLWEQAQLRGCPSTMSRVFIPPAVEIRNLPSVIEKPYETLGTPGTPFRVLSVGRLEWKKGYEHALQAIKMLVEKGIQCEYTIIGGGDYQAALYFARHQLGLEKEVTFLGEMPHAQVLERLAWADVFLHGAVSEGFCNAVLEAQAMGLPVVCSDADGLRENVAAGVTGFVVPRRNPQAMAEKLVLLAGDGGLRQKMGEAGIARVAEHFRIEDQLDAFETFYLDLIERQNYPAKMKETK